MKLHSLMMHARARMARCLIRAAYRMHVNSANRECRRQIGARTYAFILKCEKHKARRATKYMPDER